MVFLIFSALIASQIADWQVDSLVQATYKDLPTEDQRDRKSANFPRGCRS